MNEQRSYSEAVLAVSSDDEYTAKAKHIIDHISAVIPENVTCAMGVMVTTDGTAVYVLGNDAQLSKMLLALANTVRDSMQQANNPPTPPDEVKH